MVIVGDSDFASNQWAGLQHNGDFFFNTVDWLAQDENLISIRPKEATEPPLDPHRSQVAVCAGLICSFVPGIVILFGISIWWKRR